MGLTVFNIIIIVAAVVQFSIAHVKAVPVYHISLRVIILTLILYMKLVLSEYLCGS